MRKAVFLLFGLFILTIGSILLYSYISQKSLYSGKYNETLSHIINPEKPFSHDITLKSEVPYISFELTDKKALAQSLERAKFWDTNAIWLVELKPDTDGVGYRNITTSISAQSIEIVIVAKSSFLNENNGIKKINESLINYFEYSKQNQKVIIKIIVDDLVLKEASDSNLSNIVSASLANAIFDATYKPYANKQLNITKRFVDSNDFIYNSLRKTRDFSFLKTNR